MELRMLPMQIQRRPSICPFSIKNAIAMTLYGQGGFFDHRRMKIDYKSVEL